jgi:hypothetical protein
MKLEPIDVFAQTKRLIFVINGRSQPLCAAGQIETIAVLLKHHRTFRNVA